MKKIPMTNYNERLDDVLDNVLIGMYCTNPDGDFVPLDDRNNVLRAEAKQDIASLIKELVADAKPNKKPQFYCQGCDKSEERGHNQAIDQFEQNLLKALEEVNERN